MDLSVSLFARLRPNVIKLAAWQKKATPAPRNGLEAIVLFARFYGLKEIPAVTVQKLKSDPYFKYAFYPLLLERYSVYENDRQLGRQKRAGFIRLLTRPESATPKDILNGLTSYLNNFDGYLPGGCYRTMFPKGSSENVDRITANVDRVLAELGLAGKARELAAGAEIDDSVRLEHWKLALDVFRLLVERDGFEPASLWG